MESTYNDRYRTYLHPIYAGLDATALQRIEQILAQTNWENPQTALDWNNLGVVALVQAEQVEDLRQRSAYLKEALEALNQAVSLGNHPLPFAHLAIVKQLTGPNQSENSKSLFSSFINLLINAFHSRKTVDIGLIYIPSKFDRLLVQERSQLQIINVLSADNGYTQSLKLLSEVLCQANLVLYNISGLRSLNLAAHLFSDSAVINLKLGLANLLNSYQEGLLHLHRAQVLAPHLPATRQALYLAYRDMGILNLAQVWLRTDDVAQSQGSEIPLPWRWTELAVDAPITYVPFSGSLLMAVEPSLRSIVTQVLIAEGDWFEHEMEFWRYWLKPGMTVIDVGANAGVYTFSAAKQVGPSGRVFAVEPFARCVQYMEMTKQLNQLDWVTICQGAASDRQGQVRLSLSRASELNTVITDDAPAPAVGTFAEVTAFRLDDLIHQENLSQVDWLKIDAEGHEMQVLRGSDRLLTEFMPGILYENFGREAANVPVAEYLQAKGYQLFRYQPYLRRLIPIQSMPDLSGILNIIALPSKKLDDFALCQ